MMKKVIALLLAMLMVFTIAACGEQPDTTDEPSAKIESITVGTTAAIETATFGEYNFDMLASGVSELPLVYQDTKGEYHPLLATYATEDATTWTYTIQDGMTWSDGESVTAEDILLRSSTIRPTEVPTLSRRLTKREKSQKPSTPATLSPTIR